MSDEYKLPNGFSRSGEDHSAEARELIDSAGVRQAMKQVLTNRMKPGGNSRKQAYEAMARAALADAGHETRSNEEDNMIATSSIERLIADTENTISLGKRAALDIKDSVRDEGRNLTREERTQLGEIETKLAKLTRNLERMRAAKAEMDEEEKRFNDVRPTGAGVSRSGSIRMDGTSLMGAGAKDEIPEYVYRNDANEGKNAAVKRGESFGDHELAKQFRAQRAEQDRVAMGTYGSLGQQIRSLSTTGSSSLVPTDWAYPIIDKARNNAVAFQAGATLVPMAAKIVNIGRLLTDPVPTFRTEGSSISTTDPSFDMVTLTATTMSALTVMSMEFIQDAPDADSIVENALAKSMALTLDQAIFYGQLAAGSEPQVGTMASPYPRGILQNLLTNAASQVIGSGTNGTAQTAATPWNEVVQTYYQVKTKNETPSAFVSNDKLVQQYNMMYSSTNQPIEKPPIIRDVPWLTTNMIGSFTQGTMTSRATDLFAGDFSKCLVGQRLGFEMRILNERYAELGQVGILMHWRGDVQLARYNAFSVYRYLQGA